MKELVSLIKEHPKYYSTWMLEVPPEQALYLRFTEDLVKGVDSEVLEIIDGSDLVIDRDSDGKVVGIEIV